MPRSIIHGAEGLVLLFVVASCHRGASAPGEEAAPETRPPTAAGEDPCAGLEGARFESEEKKPCGPPMDEGTVPLCTSEITFSGGQYEWRVTDMLFTGAYECSQGRVRSVETEDLQGSLSPDGRQLTLEGELYHRR